MGQQPIDYDKLAREHGGRATSTPTVDYDALAREVTTPAAPTTPASPSGGVGGFFAEATQSLDPRNINAAIQSAFWSPIQTVKGVVAAQDIPRQEAMQAFERGDYVTGSRKMLNWLIPILGPRMDEASDYLQEGQTARGLGAMTDVAVNIAGPKVAAKVAVPVIPKIKAATAAVKEAVEFGLREGIPVDVATATGNRFLRGTQALSEESLLGSTLVSPTARAAQAEALTATGERLAGRTSPLPVAAEQAGQAVRDRVTATAAAYDAAADVAYGKLRALEARQAQSIAQHGGHQAPATHAQPFTTVPLAVDIAPTKAAMRPIYEALVQENAVVPFISGSQKGKALVALERLRQAPDLAPLSIADSALGELKTLARVDQAFRRTAGQGIAAEAVTHLDDAVRATAQQAGPDAFRALMEGRAATVNKFKTIELLDTLHAEPVGVFRQAVWQKDAGITKLRALARVAPQEVRQVGRAWLDQALGKATAEGGFGSAKTLLTDWQNLGPQTKQLLFGDAAHVKDLDNFFLLAKRLAENPNPSGSALTVFKGAELGALGTGAIMGASGLGVGYTLTAPVIAKLLLSPTTTRLLLQGLRLPMSAKAARLAWAGQLGRVLEAQPPPAAVPVPAGDEVPAATARPGATSGTAPAGPRR